MSSDVKWWCGLRWQHTSLMGENGAQVHLHIIYNLTVVIIRVGIWKCPITFTMVSPTKPFIAEFRTYVYRRGVRPRYYSVIIASAINQIKLKKGYILLQKNLHDLTINSYQSHDFSNILLVSHHPQLENLPPKT